MVVLKELLEVEKGAAVRDVLVELEDGVRQTIATHWPGLD